MRRDGRLVFADETRLDHAGATLDRKAVGAGARALSTIVASAPNIEARLPDLRAALEAGELGRRERRERLRWTDRRPPSRRLVRPIALGLVASIVALGGRKPRLWP